MRWSIGSALWGCARLGLALGMLVLAAGCDPRGGGDAATDQNILVGRTLVRSGRYADAEEAFLRALQNHPNSATAHLEMGKLYYEHLQDLPGALYHLSRYARLNPTENRDVLGLMTNRCLQELATLVPLGAINEQIQRESDRRAQSNQVLRVEVERLRQELARLQTTRPPAESPAPRLGPAGSPARTPTNETAAARLLSTPTPETRPPEASPSTSPLRRHKVAPKETIYAIARRYGIDPKDLIRANPGINPDRLQIGQEINLPRP